ncbi:MAG: single-stranded-DNA-specific exonuclease RecJ [Clostridia bacterium]|nr:single-stranded-DNA-specific exonuclease RecJ [Clostridia bacterium]
MFDRRWITYPGNVIRGTDPVKVTELTEAALLRSRGIDGSSVNAYFAPSSLPPVPEDPSLDAAAELILSAVEEGVKISVFGDYDCDGICASAILYHFLVNYLEADADYIIPDRFGEGYGITPEAVTRMCEQGTGLIVTVDNGITAFDAAARAEELGIAMVITDHHLSGETLPQCAALVDPHVPDSSFTFRDECGAGVAFTLIRRIAEELGIGREELEGYLMCTAIATVGDSVPLVENNRVYVRLGLDAMKRLKLCSKREFMARRDGFPDDGDFEDDESDPGSGGAPFSYGIIALLEASGIYSDSALTSTDIAFKVVPKINAAGRLGSAEKAINLLLSETRTEAREAAAMLIRDNSLRKNIEQEIFSDALTGGKMLTGENDSIVLCAGEDWHQGVLGIVASRLTEKFNRPAIVLTLSEDGDDPLYKGSGRSVENIDIFSALSACSGHLERFGGHTRAAGVSIRRSQFKPLIEALSEYFGGLGGKAAAQAPEYVADAVVPGGMIDMGFADMINAFEPFGEGNKSPQIVLTGLILSGCSRFGADNAHLRLVFSAIGPKGVLIRLEGVMFRAGNLAETVSKLKRVSVLCTPRRDSLRPDQLLLLVTDIHDFDLDVEKTLPYMYNGTYITFESFAIDADFLRVVYKGIATLPERFTFGDLNGLRMKLSACGNHCSWYRLRCSVEIFTELGLVKRLSKTEFAVDRSVRSTDLESSSRFMALRTDTAG